MIDCDHPAVIAFAEEHGGGDPDPRETARALFLAVRDGIRYDPYRIEWSVEGFKASRCLERGFGYCVTKAVLLAALGRVKGIPTRLGFADVRNHLATTRLKAVMESDLFVYHGYTEFLLEGKWVKATCAFNRSLCRLFRVPPLDFDGEHDALFQPFDSKGLRFMEYVRDRGYFTDVPLETIHAAMRKAHPKAFEAWEGGDFEEEALLEGGQ
jgi:hypothetical protein